MRSSLLVLLSLAACGAPVSPVMPDGGEAVDAGLPDAGPTDAGVVDAGTPDAGPVDAGPVDAGVPPRPVGCVTSVDAGHHLFPCSGLNYDVEVSSACAAGGCGVLVDVHGLTMNADSQDKSTRLRTLAPPRGFVVVQPTASGSLIGPSWNPGTDDAKVWGFLLDVRQALRIDPRRVHVTGFSQGGAMTWRLLLEHADELASVAPIAAADGTSLTGSTPPFVLDCPFTAGKTPSQPVPVLQMHGSIDSLVPIAKGTQQRDAALAAWNLGSPTVVATSSTHTQTRYTSADGGVYEFLEHDYVASPPWVLVAIGGHCIPGGDDLRENGALGQTMFFSCAQPNSFVWGQAVLDFFVAHPRP